MTEAELARKRTFEGDPKKVGCCYYYGPADGDIGLRKNVEFFKGWREKVGPEFPLMLDCYMALSVPYAIKLAKALQPYDLKWMEEFLPPDDYDGYVTVKDALKDTGIMLTTAEHEYTRYGFKQLIQSLGLAKRARKAIKDEACSAFVLIQLIIDQVDDDLIGNQPALVHDFCNPVAEL